MPWRVWFHRGVRFLSAALSRRRNSPQPMHMERGQLGERAAARFLRQQGLRFLTANFRSKRGEIDLVFRDGDCLVFVEVKTRSEGRWVRPAAAVDRGKRRRLSRAALDYLGELRQPRLAFRFDIVEVRLRDGKVAGIRHLPGAFRLSEPYRYG